MNRKIIGVTVGTPLSPQTIKEKLKNDGFYPTISVSTTENGYRITITDTNGTNTVDLKNGKDAYTPTKGVDYWTKADKQEMITDVISALPLYDGTSEVTPRVDSQILPTAQKIMKEDLTVKAIPYYDVSNSSGGSTIFIGNEV
jgi:hypothetical protein